MTIKNDDQSLTPMMQQYQAIKQEYPDHIVFYRLGDFYELFYDDAVVVSKELGLVLTKRCDAPMCGIPWHSSETYLARLVKNGYRIAICEQLETPEEAKKRGGCKATIDRRVTRIITQGTLIEQSMLGEKSNNFLLAISSESNGKLGIAYADVSTGRFLVENVRVSELPSFLAKISPVEIICPDCLLATKEILDYLDRYKSIVRIVQNTNITSNSASNRLAKFFGLRFIDAFGTISPQAIEAAAAIVDYVADAYKTDQVSLSFPTCVKYLEHMHLDNFTRKSLELTQSQSGDKKTSLLNAIDNTITAQGARMLSRWIMEPLTNITKINKRLEYVDFFYQNRVALEKVRNMLAGFPDIERATSRVSMNRAGPRDLKGIAIAFTKAVELDGYVTQFPILKPIGLTFSGMLRIIQSLDAALLDNLPVLARDGNFIKRGFDHELDEYINTLENGDYLIKDLQRKYITETGINSLKIKKNIILGYFIEISPNFATKVPYKFIHKQTLTTSLRYTSGELIDLANKVYSSESNKLKRELAIFEHLVEMIAKEKDNIRYISDGISFIDLTSSLAHIAIENNYVKPEITSEKLLEIEGGRHPVVEKRLKTNGISFVANDYVAKPSAPVSILTGPNMGGKSTFLRQNAIIIIMAQIGSFVPANYAKIGIVDKIFSRVGASDDIASGKSTFMVEMIETATILQQATEQSFVILDEIGRGTSTYDGLAIAWAVIEKIALDIKARTMFATHYHELIKIKKSVPNIQFLTVKVEEWDNKIVFLHKIEEGFADKSYGLNVAILAGFPGDVVEKAGKILKNMK
jgi:DNA mismatch repair protein MutS